MEDFTVTIETNKTPMEVFDAINNPSIWWSGKVEGETTKVGDEFRYRYEDIHDSTQKITELVPGKKVVWNVIKAHINFTKDPAEWLGTDIIFEITEKEGKTELKFTHKGLNKDVECYDACSSGWNSLITVNLKNYIDKGESSEDPFEAKS